jgi:nitrite reductase (NADH) large subunit
VQELGKKVQIIEFAPYLMGRQLDEVLSREFEAKLKAEGFEMYLGAGAKVIDGEDKVERILLTDGREVDTQAMIFSCGIRSNIALFKDTELKVDRAVVVNNRFETSLEGVYAAGDVAQINGFTLALWTAGMAQGKIAGKNMAGLNEMYTLEMPSTLFQFKKEKIFSTGKINNDLNSLESEIDGGKLKLFFDEDKLVGGVLMNNANYIMALKKSVKEEVDCSELLKSELSAVALIEELRK